MILLNHMKRVLIFSLAYYPKYVGGAEVAIKEITDRIADIEFHLVTLRFDSSEAREEKIGNVFVHRVGGGSAYVSKMFFILLAALKGRSLHRKYHFDGGWAMMSYMLLPLVCMRILGARIPYALTLQEGDTYEQMFRRWYIVPLLPLLRRGFRSARVVQTISTFLARWPVHMGYRGTVEIIPNGANTRDFSANYPAHEPSVLKQKLGKKEGDVYLVSTSRLVHKNALDDVICALPLLPAQVQLLLVGGGPDEGMLKKLAEERGVETRVKFVGQVSRDETPKYRKISDIFVRPSRSEGMGNSFVGAFAAGLPVIATQEGGIADFLFDAKRNPGKPATGWAVDKDNPGQIAQAVKDILANPEQVKKVIATAHQLAIEKYNWDTIARDMRERVFARVLAK